MLRPVRLFMRRIAPLLVVIALVAALLPATTVRAAGTTYYVGLLFPDDTGTATAGCSNPTNSTCTLRDALAAATSGMDTIQFNATASVGVYTLGTGTGQGTLMIAHDVTITGPGSDNVAIDGGLNAATQSPGTLVFTVNRNVSVTISGLEITHGNNQGVGGGGVYSQGGAALTLINDLIDHNNTLDIGGGVDNAFGTTLTIMGCTITGNTSSNFGGGIVTGSDVTTITNSTISNNRAMYYGGGIDDFSQTSPLNITNSAITGNVVTTAGTGGGGIYSSGGLATLTNDTISGNSAPSPGGGGIYNFGNGLTVTNSTIAHNTTSAGGVGGGILSVTNPTNIANSILAGNSGGNCAITGTGVTITDGGGDLQSDGTTCGATIPVADPKLDPAGLANNGGPTQTIALLPSSPAIDAVPASGANCPAADQRGIARPQPTGGACDIGAYEYVPVRPILSGTYTVGTGGLSLTLTGTGFQHDSLVSINGAALPVNTVTNVADNGTTLRVTLPMHAAGIVTLAVTNPGNLTSAATGNLTYQTPQVQPTPTHPVGVTAVAKPAVLEPTHTPGPARGAGTPTPLPQPVRH